MYLKRKKDTRNGMPDTAGKTEEQFTKFARTKRNAGQEVSKSEAGANYEPQNVNNIREKCTKDLGPTIVPLGYR